SPSIAEAEAHLREAGAAISAKKAALAPSASASVNFVHADLPGGFLNNSSLNFYQLGGTASWEPDIFGGNHRAVEQARAEQGQRFAQLADAQVSLSAQVAQAYINLRDGQERLELNGQLAQLQRQSLGLVQQRRDAGTASAFDVEQAQRQLQATLAQATPLAAQIDEAKDVLAVLTGQAPGALDAALAPIKPLPMPPAQVAIADPAALIQHRPDVRSAERALAASTANIGVAKAKLFPSVSFQGLFGLGGTSAGDMFDPSKFASLLMPSLKWNILDFGKAKAGIHQSEARRDAAEAQYRQAVLNALQDAETNLSKFGSARTALGHYAQTQASAAHTSDLGAQRLAQGLSTVIEQNDRKVAQLQATQQVSEAKARLTGAYIAVNKSLGLGWSEAPAGAKPAG
ncbi:MAG TPA: efflux transporter outer membrane subunit, partial [Novosphingobium sp.]|nr:efflux transporter outer membrane subunit [Novosphingobium sp.]